jgi:arginine decarboxylase
MKKTAENSWAVDDAREVYNVDHWSDGYFDINDKGELCAKLGEAKTQVVFPELVNALKRAGLTLPVLVRFSDILKDRVKRLCDAFDKARAKANYQGNYTCVYPIKVNQHRRVVEQLLGTGNYQVGLEAGSKPELMAVMALSQKKGSVIICNGYKDREYIRLALISRILGHQITLIIEKPSELELILEESQRMGIAPLLGMRIRLSSIGKGKWQNTGGEKSKFGLTAGQILAVIEKLKQVNMLDALHLIHFHLGSQIANLHDIKKGFAECAQYYAKLHSMGIAISTVDVGGGLGIDYEGTQSRNDCSRNYSVEDYAQAVISAFANICETNHLSTPHIITESGRALTAHHAVLLTQVIDTDNLFRSHELAAPSETTSPLVQDLWRLQQSLPHMPPVETYYDSIGLLTKVHEAFNEGKIEIADKAFAEDIYYRICTLVRTKLSAQIRSQRVLLDELNEKLADKLFCNFSLFQSIPDAWAIEQIFPILPLQGLLEKPTQRAVLQDLTCDSDGRINHYVDGQGIESSLPLPPAKEGIQQCLGIFLVGAYQEILGDMHNLFGDTDSVHVELNNKGGYSLIEPVLGDRVDSVLRMVHYEPQQLMQSYKQQLENAPILANERRLYLDMLASGLSGYTYLEEEH